MKTQVYNLEPYGGEKIDDFIDRLLEYYKLVNSNALVLFAAFISNATPVVSGMFNNTEINVDGKLSKEIIIKKYKNKHYEIKINKKRNTYFRNLFIRKN